MAGIGFRLNRLLKSQDLSSKVGGLISSVMLSSGPWLCSILAIALISVISFRNQDLFDRQVFRIIVNYCYAASLIGFSIIEMVTTRYIADMIYLRQERVIPTLYVWIVSVVACVAIFIGMIFFSLTILDWKSAITAAMLLASITIIWSAMIFLSSCKDYVSITLSFIIGMTLSVLGSYLFGNRLHYGLFGHLFGFTLGQMAIVCGLSYRIFREFGSGYLYPRDYSQYFFSNWVYIAVGLFYGLATWTDKIVFWFSPGTREKIAPLFHKSSAYDSGIFLAYLFTTPAMAYFLVQIETKFYMKYREYFAIIDNKAPFSMMEKARQNLVRVCREESNKLITMQLLVVSGPILIAPYIVKWIGMPAVYTTIYRYGLIASSLHIFVLFTNVLILYFDLPKLAAKNYAVFFILNGIFSYITTRMDYKYHGIGYIFAGLITLVISLKDFNYILKDLHFLIFRKQPYSRPAEIAVVSENIRLNT